MNGTNNGWSIKKETFIPDRNELHFNSMNLDKTYLCSNLNETVDIRKLITDKK